MAKKKTLSKKAQKILNTLLEKECKYCKNLDEMDGQGQEGRRPWHGWTLSCDECKAEYYREYERDTLALNEQASINHPDLQKLYGKKK